MNFLKNKQRYVALYEDANQDQIVHDLKNFFGPRAELYLQTYDKMRAKKGGFIWTWNWAVFFGMFVWFFYRKMYLLGGMLILLPVVLGILFPSLNGAGLMWIAAIAKPAYVQTGLGRILKADELGLTGEERANYLQRAGGVSLPAGIATGLLYVGMLALAIWAVMMELSATK